MRHYIAIVEDAGNKTAVGVWFPDLPGCFAASDTIEEAMVNAPEAIGLYAEVLGHALPAPRSLVDLKGDPAFLDDLRDHMIALVALPEVMTAAE